MKTREQLYKQDAGAICRDVSEYHVLRESQLLKLYPGKERIVPGLLNYLCRQGRICHQNDLYAQFPDQFQNIDYGLLNSVWVLVDMIDQAEYHAVSNEQPHIIFVVEGQVYEIIYVSPGRENEVSSVMSEKFQKDTRYIILVDKQEQIPNIDFPGAWGFCTVSPTGEVQYYEKEEGGSI